jgi:hypothetical protein
MHNFDLLTRVGAIVLAGLVAACSMQGSEVPQQPSGAAIAGAVVGQMTLEAGSAGGRSCFWLVGDDDVRHGAIWPHGTVVQGMSLVVPTSGGVVRVAPGQRIWVTGGVGEVDDDPGQVGACAAGVAVYVGSVSFNDPTAGTAG